MSAISRMLKPFLGSTEELYSIVGQVKISSTGAVTSEDIIGMSVTTDGYGQYTLAFDSNCKPAAVRACFPSLMAATAVDLVPQVVSMSTSQVVIKLLAGAIETDPSAACTLMVRIDCRKTGVSR